MNTTNIKGKTLKQILKRVDLNYNDIQSDFIDISTAGVVTLVLTAFVLAFIFINLPGWSTFNVFAFLYIAFNFTLLIKFILERARNTRTLDDIGQRLDEIINKIDHINQ